MQRVVARFRSTMATSAELIKPAMTELKAETAVATLTNRVPIPLNGVDYRGKVVLAPMVRSSELPMRLTALKYGADLVWGPETIDKALIGTTRHFNAATGTIDFTRPSSNNNAKAKLDPAQQRESIIFSLHPENEKGKLVYQMGTAHPETAVQAGKIIAADVAGIDVNSGCPKPFSTSGGMGAALLRDPNRLCSILTSLVTEVGNPHDIGISVKIRLLANPADTKALVSRLVRTGITGLTVHCRTPPMRPRERAIREQLSMVGDICRDAGVACLMNGDVTTREEGEQLAAEFGVDGAMIATAAEANPSIFRPATEGGKAHWTEVARLYMRFALEVENRWANTKFSLAQLMPGKAEAAKKCQVAKCYCDGIRALDMWEELGIKAEEVDETLGLTQRLVMQKNAAVEKAKKENKSARAAGKHVQKIKTNEGVGSLLAQRGVSASPTPAMVT